MEDSKGRSWLYLSYSPVRYSTSYVTRYHRVCTWLRVIVEKAKIKYFNRQDGNDVRLMAIFRDNPGKPVPEWHQSGIILELKNDGGGEVVVTDGAIRRTELQSNRHHLHLHLFRSKIQ